MAGALILWFLAGFIGGPPGWTHPHLTPAQIQARIQELDALLPVVQRMRLDLRIERAALQARLDQITEGLLDCRRAARLDPKSPAPARQAGELLEMRGAYAPAAVEYERALALDPADERTLLRLGHCYKELKRFADAEAVFGRAARQTTDKLARASRLVDVATVAEQVGRFPVAEAALTESIALSERWPAYLQARAEYYMRQKRFQDAARDFAAVMERVEAGENEFAMQVRQADALAAAGKADLARAAYEKAEKTITRLLSEDPAFVEDLYYWRARTRLALERGKEALADVKEALLGLPDQVEYLELMVAIGKHDGETPETKKAAIELKKCKAFEERSRQQFERVQAETRDRVKAALAQASAEVLAETIVDAAIRRLQAREPAAGDVVTLAGKRLDELEKTYPDRKKYHDFLRARLALAEGRAAEALNAVNGLLTTDPENAIWRRFRMEAASAHGEDVLAREDRAFLDQLIKRSQDEDLLAPAPPTPEVPVKGASRGDGK